MVHFITQKKLLKQQILDAIEKAGEVDKDRLIAELCLNTGFTEKTVKLIVQQLAQLGYIEINGMIISKPGKEDGA